MVIKIETLFYQQLAFCPKSFQDKFRKIYQQLKVVEDPLEIKGVSRLSKGLYRITIQNSRIALKVEQGTATIGMFLFNEYYSGPGE